MPEQPLVLDLASPSTSASIPSIDALDLGISLPFLDELYEQYRRDPSSVDPSWQALFSSVPAPAVSGNGHAARHGNGHAQLVSLPPPALSPTVETLPLDRVHALVSAFRTCGHFEAHLDPLGLLDRTPQPDLDPRSYGFTPADLERIVPPVGFRGAEGPLSLGELVERLRTTYCGSIGVELMHIPDPARRRWLQERMEPGLNRPDIDNNTRLHILDRLAAAEVLERFIHTRWVGAKRFGLDGAETLIPLLDLVLERAGLHGVEEVVIGMAHRGRLNVLSNIIGKSAGDIFTEFQDVDPSSVLGGGDVKYHLGYSSDHLTRSGHKLHLSLAFNPSHLEAVDPVVMGRVRAKQRRRQDEDKRRVLGVLVHGDAAFIGQGLVAEVLNLSQLRGYRTGGTVHVVVNNQIGFTTNPSEGRSTPYCTDVAKMIEVPIFHVNAEDPEAVAHVVRLAMDYRREFQSDVVIDLFCFRRYGHNESDEPSFTQPLLYKAIKDHPPLREPYAKKLVAEGLLTEADVEALLDRRMAAYEAEFAKAKSASSRPRIESLGGYWVGYRGGNDREVPEADTTITHERLATLSERISTVPAGFHVHPKLVRLLHQRAQMGQGELPIDWGMGEALAFGSLLWDGKLVRLTGQDSQRGTFSHRHAVLSDVETGDTYTPLANLRDGQGHFSLYDSPLSEAAVLGFEFGYSLDYPDGLVMWEAQFGDFANGAQVIIDQFISSSEDKWSRISGLTLLLPHGYEGQGPEHSSARIERFLQLAAEDNMQICQPTSPAQLFHLLRRQALRPIRKPLIVITPKSLLRKTGRDPEPLSSIAEFTSGGFQRVIDDANAQPEAVRRLIFCTGRIYYDLAAERAKRGLDDTVVVRLEQLYPLRLDDLAAVVARYPAARELVWAQDEPTNMGAYSFILPRLEQMLKEHLSDRVIWLRAAARVESASPATGSAKAHAIEEQRLLDEAFGAQ